MTPKEMYEVYYKKPREEALKNLMNDKEAVNALRLLMDKGYLSPTIREAYFLIQEDMENEK